MNWSNNDPQLGNSVNFFDSNSNCFNKIRDDSLSLGGEFFLEKEGLVPAFNFENTVNFSQLDKRLVKTEEFDILDSVSRSNICETESAEYLQEDSLSKVRKGLKDLANILLQTFKQRKVYTQCEIVKCVEAHLFKRLENKSYECKRILKNIKRRIYDAINVMISADLLERNVNQIQVKTRSTSKVYSQKLQQKSIELQQRIQKKKDLFKGLQAKNNAIKKWLRHNKNNEQNVKDNQKLRFPLIFVLKQDQKIDFLQQEQMIILKNTGLQFYSESDILQTIYENIKQESDLKIEQ